MHYRENDESPRVLPDLGTILAAFEGDALLPSDLPLQRWESHSDGGHPLHLRLFVEFDRAGASVGVANELMVGEGDEAGAVVDLIRWLLPQQPGWNTSDEAEVLRLMDLDESNRLLLLNDLRNLGGTQASVNGRTIHATRYTSSGAAMDAVVIATEPVRTIVVVESGQRFPALHTPPRTPASGPPDGLD